MNIHHISSLDLPDLEPYRTLRRPQEHIRKGIFVAEGDKVVMRLLDSGLSVLSLLLTPEWLDALSLKYSLDTPDIYVADRKLLETIVGYRLHQGIMAVAGVPEEPSLSVVMRTLPGPFVLVALDGIVSAENVGVVVRNCAAFSVQGIISGPTSASPYLRRAVRNSMGAVFRIPVFHSTSLVQTLLSIRPACRIIGASPQGPIDIRKANLSGNLCVIFGNEGSGISEDVACCCDQVIAIPMANNTDSLNVASASAVFLYELMRRQ